MLRLLVKQLSHSLKQHVGVTEELQNYLIRSQMWWWLEWCNKTDIG